VAIRSLMSGLNFFFFKNFLFRFMTQIRVDNYQNERVYWRAGGGERDKRYFYRNSIFQSYIRFRFGCRKSGPYRRFPKKSRLRISHVPLFTRTIPSRLPFLRSKLARFTPKDVSFTNRGQIKHVVRRGVLTKIGNAGTLPLARRLRNGKKRVRVRTYVLILFF